MFSSIHDLTILRLVYCNERFVWDHDFSVHIRMAHGTIADGAEQISVLVQGLRERHARASRSSVSKRWRHGCFFEADKDSIIFIFILVL